MKHETIKLTKDLKKIFKKNPWVVALVVVNDFQDGELTRVVRVVGPQAGFKDVDSAIGDAWDFEIVPRPELSLTHVATACALARPDLSYYQIAKQCRLTAGAVSKAMKPHQTQCPCCEARIRPKEPAFLTPEELKQSPEGVNADDSDQNPALENASEYEF